MNLRTGMCAPRVLLGNYSLRTTVMCLAYSVAVCAKVDAQNESRVASAPGATEQNLAAQNGLVGYDHRKHFQKKLLEFVAPVYKEALIKSQLVESLAKLGNDASLQQRLAGDQLASIGSSTMQIEQQSRIIELQKKGQGLAGSRSFNRAGGLNAKAIEATASANLLMTQAVAQEAKNKAILKFRKDRLEQRVALIKTAEIRAIHVQSGRQQNMLLDAITGTLLKFGYMIADDPLYQEQLATLTIPTEDLNHIRLKMDVAGTPVVFSATEGTSDLGKVPYSMLHPDVLPLVRKLEARMAELKSKSAPADLFSTIRELSGLLTELENACNSAIGSARECATKGTQSYRLWCLARDYRDRIRGILNRMELEGSTDILTFPRGKFDAAKHGRNALSFAKFVVDNGCQIAPALPGDEQAYFRLHLQLLKLQAILDDDE